MEVILSHTAAAAAAAAFVNIAMMMYLTGKCKSLNEKTIHVIAILVLCCILHCQDGYCITCSHRIFYIEIQSNDRIQSEHVSDCNLFFTPFSENVLQQ